MFIMDTKLFLFIININLHYCKKYNNYSLLRAFPIKDDHLRFLETLTELYDVNIWQDPGLLYNPVDFVISPADFNDFAMVAESIGINFNVQIENIDEAFNAQTIKTYVRRNMQSYDWESFFGLNDIYQWLADISLYYKDEVELIKIGKTVEGRDILAMRVAFEDSRPKVIIEGGIHAREWISPAFVTYMIYQIVTAKDSPNRQLRKMALAYEWYFVPVLNPDGYEYTHKEDRLWRKNRNPNGAVDINRNFDSAFGTVGVSDSKHRDTYCGESAFSEHETLAMKNFVTKHAKSLKFYLAFHSYGQYMILPFAYSTAHVLNFNEVYPMAIIAKKAIYQRYNTTFTIGTTYETVGYKASGGSGDWVKKEFNTPYVMCLELRDKGRYGFALPTEQILPTCYETMDGLMDLISASDNKKLTQNIIIPEAQFLTDSQDGYQIAQIVNRAISQRYKKTFTIGTAYNTVGYMASGGTGDWVKKEFNTPYVMSLELRDKGQHGFALPMEQILATCYEMMDGMIALMSPSESQKLSGSLQARVVFMIFTLVFNTLLWIIICFD